MNQITHVSWSLIIGALITNPLLAFILAFIFHFVLDAIPHEPKYFNHYKTDWKKKLHKYGSFLVLNILLILLLLYCLWHYNKIKFIPAMVWAIIGGVAPDIIELLYVIPKKKFKFMKKYDKFHTIDVHSIFYKKIFLPSHLAFLIRIVFMLLGIFIYLLII